MGCRFSCVKTVLSMILLLHNGCRGRHPSHNAMAGRHLFSGRGFLLRASATARQAVLGALCKNLNTATAYNAGDKGGYATDYSENRSQHGVCHKYAVNPCLRRGRQERDHTPPASPVITKRRRHRQHTAGAERQRYSEQRGLAYLPETGTS